MRKIITVVHRYPDFQNPDIEACFDYRTFMLRLPDFYASISGRETSIQIICNYNFQLKTQKKTNFTRNA